MKIKLNFTLTTSTRHTLCPTCLIVDFNGLYLDSKLLSRLLEDEAIENVCDALDTRRKGRRNYENVAKHYCFNIYQIEARLERSPRGPSRELIEWLSAYRPEMTIEEFARVVEGTTKRTSVVDLLREFDNVDETRL